MNYQLRERAIGYLRAYWQQIVYALLGAVLVFQIGGTLYRLLELRHVDRLIAQAESSDSKENKNEEQAPNPQMGPSNQGGGQPRKPEKDIFRFQEPKFMLTAIYLDKAVINGQPVAVGGRIGNATLVSIESFSVTIEIEGEDQPRMFEMFTGQNGGGGGRPVNNRSGRKSQRPPMPGGDMSSPMPAMQMGGGGGAGMREAMRNMPPEQRRQMLENAPPQVRERMMRRMGQGG
ncbi:MAG: hypothetical protein P9L94_15785 [Candidatus Hinthialibacter antarcticus]|nr:hypothetical protein [Candidatus Hinthialibacter antarcticus]